MSNCTRLKLLDIAKGIAIILMIIGHTSIPNVFSRFIFAFHMPLFFIASGWTTNWGKLNLVDFVVHKLRSIMVPFVFYSAIVLSIQLATNEGGGLSWIKYGWQGYALWFVPILFLASILGRIVYMVHSACFRYLVMVCLVLIGAFLKYVDLYLPWSLSSVPYACFFILLGSELKKFQGLFNVMPRWYLFVGCFTATALAASCGKLDLAWNAVFPIIPLIIGAISGTIMVLVLSSYIERYAKYLSNLLSKIGGETFVIVAFSQQIIIILHKYTSLHSIICYFILIVSLTTIVFVKNKLKT